MKHLHWLLIIAVPVLLVGSYWLIVDYRTGWSDWSALAVGVTIGLTGIWSAPWRRAAQIAATLTYVPVMGVALAVGVMFLECSTGNCL